MNEPRRRDTTSFLRPAAQELVKTLNLTPPSNEDPGHWRSADGFIAINVGIVRGSFHNLTDRLRALISFEPRDVKKRTKAQVEAAFPNYASLSPEQRRQAWGHLLRIGKQARTERVVQIIQELADQGVEVPAHNIVVHRVSNTFFATLDLATLKRIVAVRAAGYQELRRINVENIASF